MSIKLLVVGSGGREHALVWKLASEPGVSEVVCVPGNPGIARLGRCVAADAGDPQAVLAVAQAERAALTVVGPELPLSRGIADLFSANGLLLCGPGRQAARLESSKVFAKDFMARHHVPTARYRSCGSPDEAVAVLRRGEFSFPVVLKADGLAAGKGVAIPADLQEAEALVRAMMVDRRFGDAGARLVIEERLEGREASYFVLTDGRNAVPLGSAEDHKRAYDGDRGPNTGGMGAYAPSALFDADVQARVMREIVDPVLEGMRVEGCEFRGFLYVGLMLTAGGPKVIEFNVRFGDPEAQVVLPRIASELAPMLAAAASGSLGAAAVRTSPEPQVGVVLASGGYPDRYETGKPIAGLDEAGCMPDVHVFHSGTSMRGSELVTAGGRVLTVVAGGADYRQAITRAYEAVDRISFAGLHVRRDIAAKALGTPN
jgi:phosphoribosylamine---glycine ligase